MDKVAWIALLFDFYGQLLTEKQRKFIDLYYSYDFSLGEIAENHNVSRQAVYDSVKRAEKILRDYESKLGLVRRFLNQKEKLCAAVKLLNQSQINGNTEQVIKAKRILEEVLELF